MGNSGFIFKDIRMIEKMEIMEYWINGRMEYWLFRGNEYNSSFPEFQ